MEKHGSGVMKTLSYHIFDTDIFRFVSRDSLLFDKDFLNSNFRNHNKIMKLIPTINLLNQKAIEFFSQYGLRNRLMTFYQRPYLRNNIAHVDITSENDFHWYSLNIIVSGQGTMIWYNSSEAGDFFKHPQNPTGILYKEFTDISVLGDPIDKWNEGKISLVKTGIPHLTYNDSDQERIVISVRWDPIFSWEDAVDLVEKFINEN